MHPQNPSMQRSKRSELLKEVSEILISSCSDSAKFMHKFIAPPTFQFDPESGITIN